MLTSYYPDGYFDVVALIGEVDSEMLGRMPNAQVIRESDVTSLRRYNINPQAKSMVCVSDGGLVNDFELVKGFTHCEVRNAPVWMRITLKSTHHVFVEDDMSLFRHNRLRKALPEYDRFEPVPIPWDDIEIYRTPPAYADALEFEINTCCNVNCKACNRFCGKAPTLNEIPLDTIRAFIDESIDTSHQWKKITVLGGEPTIHPQVIEICGEVLRYKEAFKDCRLTFFTNGYGPKVAEVIPQIEGMEIINTSKQPGIDPPGLRNMTIAPIDCHDNRKIRNCRYPHFDACGVEFTPLGLFACGPGANIARVLGYDLGVHRIADLTAGKMTEFMRIVCQYCGYSKNHRVRWSRDKSISPTWGKILDNYKHRGAAK